MTAVPAIKMVSGQMASEGGGRGEGAGTGGTGGGEGGGRVCPTWWDKRFAQRWLLCASVHKVDACVLHKT